MKKQFEELRFGEEALATIERANLILEEYEKQGYDLSLRQLYYQFVARGYRENSERSYKSLGDTISRGRLAGLIDWEMIKDRGREAITNSHWEDPKDILRSAAYSLRLDKWSNQSVYVEVMVEKQALEGVLVPVCKELDITFTSNKGYSSSSYMYEAGQRLREYMMDDRVVHIIYLGDHDPSGLDMTFDVAGRLALFTGLLQQSDIDARRDEWKEDMLHGRTSIYTYNFYTGMSPIHVHRIALNMDQVREMKPPPNPTKMTDGRAKGERGYQALYGDESWELDAIRPDALAGLVRDTVINLRDPDLWDEMVAKEKEMRDDLKAYADAYGK